MRNKNNPTPSFLSFWLKSAVIKIVIIAVVVLVAVLAVRHCIGKISVSPTSVGIAKNEGIDITPMQVESIESIGEWEFLTISDEELVDTVRHGFFSDDELVRIYYGTLRLGINMREAHEGWLTVDGDTLRATLPPVRLLDNNFIDETRTRSFIESGKWSHEDRKTMYNRAAAAMRRRCLTRANYDAARINAVQQFSHLLRSMGYEKIAVKVDNE